MKKVNLTLLKKLRETTWVSFALCKQALLAVDNDFEKALAWLKKQGIAKGMKKTTRQSNEGVCQVFIEDNRAVLLALGCETDFVAKNQQFLDFFKQLGDFLLSQNVSQPNQVLSLSWKGETVENTILHLSGLLGEKISLKKYLFWEKKSNQAFSCYNHNNNQICSLLLLNKGLVDQEDLAMHVVALEPRFISLKDVDQSFIDQEKQIIVEQVNKHFDADKPLFIKEKMIAGKLKKHLQEICLLEQKFVKNPQQSVGDFLDQFGVVVEKMYTFKVGGE